MLFNEENRVPNSKEIENRRPFLQRQIQYLSPKVIVLLGKLTIEALLGLTRQKYSGDLNQYIRRKESWNGATVICFPPTSGTSR